MTEHFLYSEIINASFQTVSMMNIRRRCGVIWRRIVMKRGLCYQNVRPLHSWVTPKRFKITKYTSCCTIERCL